jgi:hypothetical protein
MSKIKVIKKGEREQQKQTQVEENKHIKNTKELARAMTATVKTWIEDFNKKRQKETERAMEKLFAS